MDPVAKIQKPPTVNERLTLMGKLDMLTAVGVLFTTGFISALTGILRSSKDAPSLFLHIAYAVLRKATTRLSPLQLQFISPTTDVMYKKFARSKKFTPQTVQLPHGAQGHWIGNKNAKNVIIWYHGGGFCLPANIGYFKFWTQLVNEAASAGKDIAVFALTYSLAPQAVYPTQLRQAVEAARYIITQTDRKADQVLLGGDSAGGNLVFSVLSHIAQPHPAIEPLDLQGARFAGAVTIAAWTSLDPANSERSDVDDRGDLVTPLVGKIWGSAYLGGAERDAYTDASDAPADWYKRYAVKQILMCGGEHEILLPVIEDFHQKLLDAGLQSVELFIGKKEAHVAPVYNIYVGYNYETTQGKKVKSWIRDVI